jgi:hypothetical protein
VIRRVQRRPDDFRYPAACGGVVHKKLNITSKQKLSGILKALITVTKHSADKNTLYRSLTGRVFLSQF